MMANQSQRDNFDRRKFTPKTLKMSLDTLQTAARQTREMVCLTSSGLDERQSALHEKVTTAIHAQMIKICDKSHEVYSYEHFSCDILAQRRVQSVYFRCIILQQPSVR